MLFLMETRVNIGVNDKADETVRDGVLWVVADVKGEKKNLRVPVVIDRPFLIEHGLNYATWRRLKRQIEKMGINATHLELKIQGKRSSNHFCYKLDEYKEIYARGKGQPLWSEAYV
ncbi:hypothetical protein [Ralstonia phage RP31]|uniref:Uncharacterized protein n=2 Tax=Ripduovirus RP12 TaxID=2560700 RepID=A0A1L7N145_9CAUD|nr:hypothetical protein FDH28_gp197 [Ralstonia phage RP12]BAW19198.1 hypothetical protein [Ralstonia phage RP12]BAW19484.1 hypothetical protein [Ralstonia phage RP31]